MLIRSLDLGGAERQLSMLASGLAGAGHQVAVATFYPGGPLEDEVRQNGVEVVGLEKHGRWDLIAFAVRFLRFMERRQPDVLYTWMDVANVIGALARPLTDAALVWGIRASDMELERYGLLRRVAGGLEAATARIPDRIVVNSHAGCDLRVEQGVPPARMEVVPNGIDTDRFRPDTAAGKGLRETFGWGDEPVVGNVGRLGPMKDHGTFLRALQRVMSVRPEARGLVVGAGDDRHERSLHRLSRKLGIEDRVTWAGERTDMRAVYNALDLLVLSSAFGEGMPNVVAEAMACGTPCVVTDVGDAARLVGDQGSVVPPRDPDALGDAILRMLDLPEGEAAKLREAARARIRTRYPVRRMVERTQEVLQAAGGCDGGVP